MKRLVILVLAGLCVVGSVFAQVVDFSTLQGKYEAAKAKIEADCGKAKDAAKTEYGNALAAAMVALKAKGNLDGYLAVEKAKKQFDADGRVPEEGNGAVRAYRETVKKADADALAKTYTLNKNYANYLESLIKQLMQADKIEEAKQVKEELDRVKFEMADAETKQPKAEEAKTDSAVETMKGVSTSRLTGKKMVLWNGYGANNDVGTLACNILLYAGARVAWEVKDIDVPWKAGVDCCVTSDIPAGLRFDKVRVEIIKWPGLGGGLMEIQVFDGKKNIAENCRTTGSSLNQVHSPENVTDGITSSREWQKMWVLPFGQPGWVEIDLTKKASGKDKK